MAPAFVALSGGLCWPLTSSPCLLASLHTSRRPAPLSSFSAPSLRRRPSSFRARRGSAPTVAGPARMAATATATSDATSLSHKATELLSYLRAHKSVFSPGVGFIATHLALYRKNDTAHCLVPADELNTNADMLPGVHVARLMLHNRDAIVEKAVADARAADPLLAHDEVVAKILDFDLGTFYRIVSYGAAVCSVDFIHANNLGMVKELYAELGLSAAAVSAGLGSMKEAVVTLVDDKALAKSTADCFDAVSSFLTS